jgi:hypothetical protein
MHRKSGVLTALVAVGVMAVGVASVSAAPKQQTIRLLEVDTSFTGTGGFPTTNNGGPPAVGQGFISQATMYKWAGAKRGAPVGHLHVIGTITSIDPSRNTGWFHVDATLFLPAGMLEASGSASFSAKENEIPIVGGTGAYVGAQGYVQVKNIGGQNSNTSSNVIHITN